jgi:hypothetical protein
LTYIIIQLIRVNYIVKPETQHIEKNTKTQFYLDRPLNYIYKPYICKMRISAHNLNIETGRFYNLDRHERVCSMCNLNVVDINDI